jgi:O-antigen ligase
VFRSLSLFLMVVNDIDIAQRRQSCAWLFVASTGISVAWGLVNYFARHQVRFDLHSLGHPNTTAMYLVVMFALLISLLLLVDWSNRGRMAVGVVAGATLLGLFLTYSRGGWIAFLACLAFLSISLKRVKPFLVVAVLTVAILVALQTTGRLWTWRVTTLPKVAQEENAVERFKIWRASLLSIKERPLLGVGPRNFRRLDPARYGFKEPYRDAHNLYLNTAVERGTIGLLVLLALLICYVWKGMSLRRTLRDGLDGALWHAAMGSFVAIVVGGLFNTALQSEVAIAFWLLTALMLAPEKGAGPPRKGLT